MNTSTSKSNQDNRPIFRNHGGFGGPVQKAKDFRGTLWRFSRYLYPHRWKLTIVFFAAIFSTVFNVFSPYVLGQAITSLFTGLYRYHGIGPHGVVLTTLSNNVLTLLGLYVLSSVFSFIQQYTMAGVAQKTVYVLRQQVDDKISRLALRYFDEHAHGDLLSRFINDFDIIANSLQQSLTQIITSTVSLVGVVIMMLTINVWMTLVIFVTLPLSVLATMFIAKRSQRYFKEQQRMLGTLNGHVEEMYTGHTVVRAFGQEERSIAEFEKMNEQLFSVEYKAQFISGVIMPVMGFIGNIGYVFVSVFGGYLIVHGSVGIGGITSFTQYTSQFSQPITQLASIANILQSTMASAERVFEILDEQEEIADPAEASVISDPKGRVALDRVAFSYKEDEPLIRDLSVEVQPGKTVAIVGPTGAGKTTLVNLLMRFYEVNDGRIQIDEADIATMRRGELRRYFGMVLQDTWLFHGTIRDNIAYGKENATMEEVKEAAKAAFADHFIQTLPDGYETMINEEATDLSAGQKQLLTIARAILADPLILLLDEATSSVDTRTELLVSEAMQKLRQNRTSFIIAHRLSTIRDADWILVMDHGRVIEQGTHLGLLEQKGFYEKLYNSQFSQGVLAEMA